MRRARGAVGALWLVLAVGACNDDPEPKFADPTPETPSNTSDPTSTPPTTEPTTTSTPEPEPEPMSPEKTVRAWVEARNTLMRSGEPAEIYALSSSDCKTCEDLVKGLPEIYRAGGFVKTKGWIVEGARRKPDFDRSRTVATALLFSAGVFKKSDGARQESFDEERNFLDFRLVRVDGRWLVDRVVFLA